MKRRLYLQIYLVIIASIFSIVMVVMISALLFHKFGSSRFDQRTTDVIAQLVQSSLPAADSPAEQQKNAILLLGQKLRINISLFDRNRRIIAAKGEAFLPPDPSTDRSDRRWNGNGFSRVLKLPDGRWIVTDLGDTRDGFPLLGLVFFLLIISICVGVVAFPFVRRLTRRLEQLQRGVERVGSGDLATRVEVRGQDEVAALAASFNKAAEKIEILVGAHRLLLANASHELRTPLSRIRVGMELLVDAPSPARAAALRQDVSELDDLIDEILMMSRLGTANCADLSQNVDLVAILAEECSHYEDCDYTGSAPAFPGDARLLHRMVRNLLENAMKHGKPPIVAEIAHRGDLVFLTVSDQGGGIDENLRESVFQPFFRGADRQNVKGYGLGLALVRQIAEAHGGTVHILPSDQAKSSFRVTLQACAPNRHWAG